MEQGKGTSIDQECIRGNADEVELCVWEVINRPRYFQWNEQMGLASGSSQRHPYRGNHGQ